MQTNAFNDNVMEIVTPTTFSHFLICVYIHRLIKERTLNTHAHTHKHTPTNTITKAQWLYFELYRLLAFNWHHDFPFPDHGTVNSFFIFTSCNSESGSGCNGDSGNTTMLYDSQSNLLSLYIIALNFV